jgi:hypothetical protein
MAGQPPNSPAQFNARAQFFVTRGYAFLDLTIAAAPLRRTYRNLLREQWGPHRLCDDAVTGALTWPRAAWPTPTAWHHGVSAGGYAVLQALVRYPGVFRAGIACTRSATCSIWRRLAQVRAALSRFHVGPLPATANVTVSFAHLSRRPHP